MKFWSCELNGKCQDAMPTAEAYASMTFRRKPFRRMRLPVEPDITSNATIRRIFVDKHLVEWTSVEISSKIRRNLVEKWDNAKMKVTYQKSAMRMRLEMTGMIVYTTDKMWCYGSPKKGKEFNRTIWHFITSIWCTTRKHRSYILLFFLRSRCIALFTVASFGK